MSLTANDVTNFLEPFVKKYGKNMSPERFVQEFIEYKKGAYNSIHMSVSGLNELFGQVFPQHNIVVVTDNMKNKNLIGKMPSSFRSKNGKNIFGYKIWNIDPNAPKVSAKVSNTVDALIAQVLSGQTKSTAQKLQDMGIASEKIANLSSTQLDRLLELAQAEQSTNTVESKPKAKKANKPAIL